MADGFGGTAAAPTATPTTTFTVVGIRGVSIPLASFGGEIDVPAAAGPSELIGAALAQVTAARPEQIVVTGEEHLDPLSAIVVRRLRAAGHRIVERPVPPAAPPRPAADTDLTAPIELLAVAGALSSELWPRLFDAEQVRRLREAGVLGPGEPLRLARAELAARAEAGMGIAARRHRAGQVVRAVLAAAGSGGITDARWLVWVAELMTRADVGCVDPTLLVAASAAALTMGEPLLGRRLATFAVEHGGGVPARLQEVAAAAWSGDGAAVEAALAEVDRRGAPAAIRAFCAFVGAGSLAWNDGDVDAATALLRRRRDELGEVPEAVQLDAMLALLRYFAGDVDGADALAEPLLTSAEPVAVVWASTAAASARAARGDAAGAEAAIAAGLDAARRCDSGVQRFTLAVAAVDAAVADGDPARALRHADDFDARAAGAPHASAVVAVARGRALLAAGRLKESAAAFESALVAMETMPRGWQAVAGAGLAQALGELGRHAGAVAALRRAEAEHLAGMAVYAPDLALAGAWASAARGDVTRAVEAAREAVRAAVEHGDRASECRARLTLARLGDRGPALPGGGRSPSGPPSARAVAGFARAVRARDPRALARAARGLEDDGFSAAAADAWAWAAVEYERAAEPAEAVAAAAAMRACPDARTPARWAAETRAAGLSGREQQVARELARGGDTRALADRLGVSARTVEGHVHHVLGKLGVRSRVELADALPWREAED